MAHNRAAEIDDLLLYGLDRKNRRIYFGLDEDEIPGMFSWSSIETAIRNMHKLISDNPKKPIELHMSSPGGSSVDMLRLYDEIQSAPCKIIFVGGGEISSSATWIMAGCDERRLHQNTILCFHDGFDGMPEDRHNQVMIAAKQSELHMDILYQIYAENSIMPYEFWADLCIHDMYLTAEEAIALGLADELIPYEKRGNYRRSRIAKMSHSSKKEKEIKALTKELYNRTRRRKVGRLSIDVKQEEFNPILDAEPVFSEPVEPVEPNQQNKEDL